VSRRPLLIGVAAALGLLVFWFLFLWSPQGSKITKAKERAAQAESERQELQLRIARLKSLQQAEPQKRAQLESLRVAIPDEPNLAQFILDANTAANTSGIEFLSISPSPPSSGTGPSAPGSTPPPTTPATPAAPAAGARPAVISLQLSVSGGYFQVVDFVNRLNGLSRLVVVDSLGLTASAQAAPDSTGLSVAISARMFVREATPVAGSTGAPVTPGGATTTTAPGATTTTSP
jgi:Tfp pilus assembly protein PilO